MIKQYITTTIGVFICIFGGVALWCDKITWLPASVFFILGITFVLSKDPKWMKDLLSKILSK